MLFNTPTWQPSSSSTTSFVLWELFACTSRTNFLIEQIPILCGIEIDMLGQVRQWVHTHYGIFFGQVPFIWTRMEIIYIIIYPKPIKKINAKHKEVNFPHQEGIIAYEFISHLSNKLAMK